MADAVRLRGTPLRLDERIRPFARLAQWFLGLVPTVVLGFLGLWWWAPLPLALSFVAYEAVFWWRGDRPVVLDLDGERLVLDDRRGGRRLELPLDEVHTATVHVRAARRPDRREAVLVLTDDARVRFACRFLVEPATPLLRHDVQLEALDRVLGGLAGLLRAVAPSDAACRQTIDDPAAQALQHLRRVLPARVWDRTAVRVWTGEAPTLDAFGLHLGEPDGLLVLDGDHWRLRRGSATRAGAVTLLRAHQAHRTIGLVRRPPGGEEVPAAELPIDHVELPLLLLELDEHVTLAVPAPGLETTAPEGETDDDTLHTHVPEGAAALWHVLTRWPPSTWPVALRHAADEVFEHVDPPRDGSVRGPRRSTSPSPRR